ncbi:MAG: DEAD/DEAH box helicase [Thermomicrobiales bacterium]
MGESAVSFTDLRLSNTTLQAIARMGIETPTPIQAETLPPLLDGRDVIGQARTGSGKTLAFGIPAVELVDPRQRTIQVLVLTPTRELAVQVGGVLEELGAAKGVKVGLIFGGRAFGPQRDMLRRGVQIVVGTPGRVLDLLNQGALWLDKVRFLVLDEADEMLDRGFAPDVERIIARTTPDRQTALFSATLPDWVRKTSDKHLDRPISAAVDPNPEDAAPIEHVAYDVPGGDKMGALQDLLDHRGEGSILVFGRTKHGVKKLARQLIAAGYPVAALQGNLSQNARDQVMADFRSGAVPVLLATNVAARGLDVTHVEQVINMELPESPELLTHRIGRTGRMGRRGQAITLLGLEDGAKWRQLERGLGRRIPRAPWRGATAARATTPEDLATLIMSTPTGSAQRPRTTSPKPTPPPAVRAATGASNGATSRGPRSTTRHSPNGAAPRPNGRPVHAEGIDDPRADVVSGDARPLATSFGRDPHRPSWAPGNGTTAPNQSAGAARSDRAPRPRRLHRIDCAACGQTAEVPFQPDPSRPVYCAACFQQHGRGARQSRKAHVQA